MKLRNALSTVVLCSICGAGLGFAEASGIMALLESGSSSNRSWRWRPITNEEYRRRERTYPVYGAAAGFLIGLVLAVRAGSESDADSKRRSGW